MALFVKQLTLLYSFFHSEVSEQELKGEGCKLCSYYCVYYEKTVKQNDTRLQ